MSNRKIIILVVCVVILSLFGLAFYLSKNTTFFQKTQPKQTDTVITFPTSPNGNNTETPTNEPVGGTSTNTLPDTNNTDGIETVPNLQIVSQKPVTGFLPILGKQSSRVRYAEAGTSYIFDSELLKPNPEKQVGMTLPRVGKTLFSEKGDYVLFQYTTNDNTEIRTYLGQIIITASSSKIVGNIIPGTILDALFVGNILITLEKTPAGSALYRSTLGKKDHIQFFESPLSEWILGTLDAKTITLQSKPLSGNEEFLFRVDIQTGDSSAIASGLGMTSLVSPDGKMVLRGEGSENTLRLSVAKVNSQTFRVLPVKTLAEKCAWAGDSVTLYCLVPEAYPDETPLPDAWYQGKFNFRDFIYRIDTTTGKTTLLIPDNSPEKFDGEMVTIDQNDGFLLFRDKITGLLWRFIIPDIE